MQIALYQGTSWISKAIRWQTRGQYSHAAIMFDDGSIIEAWHNPGYVREQYSLSDGHTPGIVVDIYKVETTREQDATIRVFLLEQIGKKYDYRAIARFISRSKRDNPDRWFCSELVFEAFRRAGVHLLERVESHKVHPAMLGYSPLLKYAARAVTI